MGQFYEASLFYGVGALNARTIGATVVIIGVSSLAASWLAAIRAASVERLTAPHAGVWSASRDDFVGIAVPYSRDYRFM